MKNPKIIEIRKTIINNRYLFVKGKKPIKLVTKE
jgi:hypothetical protein